MQLHQLQRRNPNKSAKPRVGRGGKRGTTSGKGTKGQKARAGRKIRPGLRDYLQRLPKFRGSKNKRRSKPMPYINIGDLEKRVPGNVLNEQSLGGHLKILSSGSVTRAFIVQGLSISKKAKEKILAAGGKVM